MGTRWRGLLAPLGTSTGDGRRFLPSGISHRELPLPLKWQRTDDAGHDTSVIIGMADTIDITDDGVWGEGELFDEVDPAVMPRLAEDVAEAKQLLLREVIGPSVDPGAAEAVLAEAGSDEPLTEDRLHELLAQASETGNEPEIDLLFTVYEIAAATLVATPAFAECRPFDLETPERADGDDDAGASMASSVVGLLPSLTAAAGLATRVPADVFSDPRLTALTMLTVGAPDERGFTRVFGHIAPWGVCHVGIRDTCTVAPSSEQEYTAFHRYHETADGLVLPVPVGRITAGFGGLAGSCRCCPGKDDHACRHMSMGAAVSHHDRMATVAYVRAGEDEHGVWVSGILAPEASDQAYAALRGQRVSGDWRDMAGGLELVEVLALSRERPGFPLPRTALRHGRQVSLVAAGVWDPSRVDRPVGGPAVLDGLDYSRLGQEIAAALQGHRSPEPAAAAAVGGSSLDALTARALAEEIGEAELRVLRADLKGE